MSDEIREALRVLFEATGAIAIELHSGDREPGMFIERWTIIPEARGFARKAAIAKAEGSTP